jgi:crotonobetaine/carnitine-CoA ligase
MPGVLDAQAHQRPDQLYMHIGEVPTSYAQMRDRSIAVANGLLEAGVQPGETVAIFAATSPEWVVTWFATQRVGAIAAAVNAAYRGDYLAVPLADSAAAVIVTDDVLLDRVLDVADRLPALRSVVVRRTGSAPLPSTSRLTIHAFDTLLDAPSDTVRGGRPQAWNEPGTVFFTSGTTGASKAVLATPHYLMSSAKAASDCWGLGPGEAVWSPLPLFHLSTVGTVLGPLLAGGSSVLETSFSPTRAWDRIREFSAVGMVAAGAIVNMLWSLPADPRDADVPIRFISAAPIAKENYQGLRERYHCEIVIMYGLTEAFPLTVKTVRDPDVPGASGRANPNFDVRILDGDDVEAPTGQVGEIACRPLGPHVMSEGYLGQPAVSLARSRNLWFHTGDLGRMDDDGNLYYVDRSKDAMRRRGENVSSFEVEQSVLTHPAVAEAAAIGVPSELGEDDVLVCVVLADPAAFEVREFMDHCSARMPYFAVPRYVDVLDALPKNALGRVTKDDLRARGVASSAWDRDAAGYVVQR